MGFLEEEKLLMVLCASDLVLCGECYEDMRVMLQHRKRRV